VATTSDVRRGGVGHYFGAYDVHSDVLFGGHRLAKTTTEALAFYKSMRRRYTDHLRIYLVNDNLSLHWTPQIRAWAESHNVDLVPTPTSASHLNRIECHFRPLREFVLNASGTTPATRTWPSLFVAISAGAIPTITTAASDYSNPVTSCLTEH
jgi:hypothetical protein